MIRAAIFTTVMVLGAAIATTSLSGPTFAMTTAVDQTPSKTTNSGVYTAAQAERGKKVFEAKCTACHDTARFTGDTFLDPWAGKPLKDVWDIASGTMQEDNPGSLPQQDYGDIIAYFLHLNAFAPGEAELKGEAAAMAAIMIEKKK